MAKVEKCVPNSSIAFNHSGMVNEGVLYFEMMTKEYNIEPSLMHYGCFVNLYARAGHIQEASKARILVRHSQAIPIVH
jgi:hypothetical protein